LEPSLSTSPSNGPVGPQFHSKHGDGERKPLRSYSEVTGRRDVDQFEQAIRLKALMWSFAGAIMGALMGVFIVVADDDRGIWIVPVCAVIGWLIAFLGPLGLAQFAGRAAGNIHNPSGRTTPAKKEYSQAEAFAIRGMYEDAVSAFELAIAEGDGRDPTPYLRIARTYRDDLARPADSERWFKRALKESQMPGGQEWLTRRELVELYRGKMGTPAKAAPLLARMAQELEGTREGEWAATELLAVKAELLSEERRAED